MKSCGVSAPKLTFDKVIEFNGSTPMTTSLPTWCAMA